MTGKRGGAPVRDAISYAQEGGRKLLIPFLTAGFPDIRATKQLALAAFDAGADMLELGAPFSDPVADGPAIQYSSQRALSSGITLSSILALAESLSVKSSKPILLMGYYNPILASGVERYVRRAVDSGVSGLIVPDLPPDEAGELRTVAHKSGMSLVFLVAPTSRRERIRLVNRYSTDFVYAVTVAGVTGARKTVAGETLSYLKSLRSCISKPFVAGFGVSTARSAQALGRYADGVVVGSALIDLIRKSTKRNAVRDSYKLLLSMRRALDRLD